MENKSEKFKYNPNLVRIDKIPKRFHFSYTTVEISPYAQASNSPRNKHYEAPCGSIRSSPETPRAYIIIMMLRDLRVATNCTLIMPRYGKAFGWPITKKIQATRENYVSISFYSEWDMIVVTVFEPNGISIRFKNRHHDHIPFTVKGNGNIVSTLYWYLHTCYTYYVKKFYILYRYITYFFIVFTYLLYLY